MMRMRDQEERQQPERRPAPSRAQARASGRGVQPGQELAARKAGHYSSSRIWQSSGSQATAAGVAPLPGQRLDQLALVPERHGDVAGVRDGRR